MNKELCYKYWTPSVEVHKIVKNIIKFIDCTIVEQNKKVHNEDLAFDEYIQVSKKM